MITGLLTGVFSSLPLDDQCFDGSTLVPCDSITNDPGALSPSNAETFIGFGFGAFLLISLLMFAGVIALGVIGVVWQRRKAAEMARKAGLDEEDAKTVVTFGQGGIETAYLAAQLRGAANPAAPAAPVPTAEARLRELQGLLDQALITQAEFDERRAAIINGI